MCFKKWFCKPKPPAPPLVKVTVCSETLLLPNPYCPTLVIESFPVDGQPTKTCAIHEAPPLPPAKTKVAEPWAPGGDLRAWSGGLYSFLSATIINEPKLDALYEAMAIDGVNAERNFAWFTALEDGWEGAYLLPWNDGWSWNEPYWAQLDRRLSLWCGDRNGCEIISVMDACSMYSGSSWEVNPLHKIVMTPAEVFYPGAARITVTMFARELVKRTKKYGALIIYETRNEGNQIVAFDGLQSYDEAIIEALKSEGVPTSRIAIDWYDSSMFYETLRDDLEGKGLGFTHQVNSEKSADWYRDSPGKQGLAALGDRPSGDGPDFYPGEPTGLKWFWLPGGEARRPSAAQVAYIIKVMRDLGYGGYEILSASAFQTGLLPDLKAAIEIGRAERQAMRRQ